MAFMNDRRRRRELLANPVFNMFGSLIGLPQMMQVAERNAGFNEFMDARDREREAVQNARSKAEMMRNAQVELANRTAAEGEQPFAPPTTGMLAAAQAALPSSVGEEFGFAPPEVAAGMAPAGPVSVGEEFGLDPLQTAGLIGGPPPEEIAEPPVNPASSVGVVEQSGGELAVLEALQQRSGQAETMADLAGANTAQTYRQHLATTMHFGNPTQRQTAAQILQSQLLADSRLLNTHVRANAQYETQKMAQEGAFQRALMVSGDKKATREQKERHWAREQQRKDDIFAQKKEMDNALNAWREIKKDQTDRRLNLTGRQVKVAEGRLNDQRIKDGTLAAQAAADMQPHIQMMDEVFDGLRAQAIAGGYTGSLQDFLVSNRFTSGMVPERYRDAALARQQYSEMVRLLRIALQKGNLNTREFDALGKSMPGPDASVRAQMRWLLRLRNMSKKNQDLLHERSISLLPEEYRERIRQRGEEADMQTAEYELFEEYDLTTGGD